MDLVLWRCIARVSSHYVHVPPPNTQAYCQTPTIIHCRSIEQNLIRTRINVHGLSANLNFSKLQSSVERLQSNEETLDVSR